MNEIRMIYEAVKRVNDKGEKIPEVCPKCGSKIGLYFRGEPVWLCSNKKCEKYFGTLPFKESVDEDDMIKDIKLFAYEKCKDLDTARKFVSEVGKLAKKYNANYFIVTDGASGTSNSGNPAVKHARDCQIEWEKKNGFDPDEDWSINESANIKKSYGIYCDNNGTKVYNAIVEVDGYKEKMRGRSELLIIKGDTIYISKSKKGLCSNEKGFSYDVPGGGWEPNESHEKAALREAQEEARITAKNIKYCGNYVVTYQEPKKWIQEKIPKKDWWYGYYTEVFIGEYDSKYNGHIDDVDKDEIIDTGKFYKIKDVWNELNSIHQKAILDYTGKSINNSVNESALNRSELHDDVFGIPEERKFPMPDEKHVRSAIKFFNYVEKKYEKELATNIIANMEKYGISKSVVGEKNRLRKYL